MRFLIFVFLFALQQQVLCKIYKFLKNVKPDDQAEQYLIGKISVADHVMCFLSCNDNADCLSSTFNTRSNKSSNCYLYSEYINSNGINTTIVDYMSAKKCKCIVCDVIS